VSRTATPACVTSHRQTRLGGTHDPTPYKRDRARKAVNLRVACPVRPNALDRHSVIRRDDLDSLRSVCCHGVVTAASRSRVVAAALRTGRRLRHQTAALLRHPSWYDVRATSE
jgi:hypothetical protein